jgi:hypothetical protein
MIVGDNISLLQIDNEARSYAFDSGRRRPSIFWPARSMGLTKEKIEKIVKIAWHVSLRKV